MLVDPEKKLTPKEAAQRIGLASGHLANLRSRGTGPAFLKLGRKVMYTLGDVDAWVASKRVTMVPPGSAGRRSTRPQAQPQQASAA